MKNTPTATKTLTSSIEQIATQLNKATEFVKVYGELLPDTFGYFTIRSDYCIYTVSLTYESDSNKERALALIGDLFGTKGWTSKPDAENRNFDWFKLLPCGVKVKIYGAAKMPEYVEQPVPPTAFPLALTVGEPIVDDLADLKL